MKVSEAVAFRIREILASKNLSQYKLEKIIAMPHSTMNNIIKCTNDAVNLKSVMQIIRGLNMTTAEFFNHPIFEDENLEIY